MKKNPLRFEAQLFGIRTVLARRSLAVLLACTGLAAPLRGELAFQLFYSFQSGASAPYAPYAAVVQGTDGDFYGTTIGGGQGVRGTVFRISADAILTQLWAFPSVGSVGASFARLLEGVDGNFYGTTTNTPYVNYASGTLFRITPGGSLTTLALFHGTNQSFGAMPLGSLIQTTDGSVIGTTYSGGAGRSAGLGTIFRYREDGVFSGVLSFNFDGTNGAGPRGGMIQASDGSLYGTTTQTGSSYFVPTYGTIFRISPEGIFSTLYTFQGTNGHYPSGSLLQASDGNLYGTTSSTLFKITTNGVFTSLVNFGGAVPTGELIQLNDGNLYGTTVSGGANNLGTVFRTSTNGAYATIVSFNSATGSSPQGGLIQARDGNLYGTTSAGGPGGGGTVFRLVSPPVITSITPSNGIVTLSWNSFVGAAYRVEYRSEIASGSWLTLIPRITSSGISTSYSESLSGVATRYYRVVLLPP